jgi:hypothetical protein
MILMPRRSLCPGYYGSMVAWVDIAGSLSLSFLFSQTTTPINHKKMNNSNPKEFIDGGKASSTPARAAAGG